MPELPPDNEGNPACEQLGWTRFTHDIEIKGDVRHKGPEPKGERKKRFIPRCAERERPKGSGSGNGSGSGPQPPGPALRCSPALLPPPPPPTPRPALGPPGAEAGLAHCQGLPWNQSVRHGLCLGRPCRRERKENVKRAAARRAEPRCPPKLRTSSLRRDEQ